MRVGSRCKNASDKNKAQRANCYLAPDPFSTRCDIANEGPLGTARREMEADASDVMDDTRTDL
jgi:hypothetical protein